jgi:insulysin
MKTIKDRRQLKVVFPIDWQRPLWEVKPAGYISHFVGHEGPGSLHAYLKKKGWVDSLSAGGNQLAPGIANFNVSMSLTTEGLGACIDARVILVNNDSLSTRSLSRHFDCSL